MRWRPDPPGIPGIPLEGIVKWFIMLVVIAMAVMGLYMHFSGGSADCVDYELNHRMGVRQCICYADEPCAMLAPRRR